MRRRRRTLRTRLALLYAGPFFVSAALLLTIPLSQTSNTVPANSVPGGGAPHQAQGGRDLHQVLTATAIALGLAVVVSIVIGWWIAGRFLRPLQTITATARDISASNLHRRLGLAGPDDEFKDLSKTLDDLFARLQAAFESQRHFVANASHELRTPLTAERALLQVALADPDADVDQFRATCQDVLALGEQQERLIEALLTLASTEQGIEHREPFDLAALAAETVALRQSEAQRRGIHVETTLGAAPATGDRRLVTSLLANLLANAVRHNTPGGRVWLATALVEGRATVTITNTGPVIPPDQVERLFQPFQRLGDERTHRTDGHGLGLAIVRAIANAHGATIVPQARAEGGLTIEVRFPS